MFDIQPKPEVIKQVAFLGGAGWEPTDQAYLDAFETAKLLTQNGFEIFNGGGPGVMRAATLGAQAAGGDVIAITYHPNKPTRHYEGVDTLNTFNHEIITLDYFDRTKVMLETTDAHIVFNGSIGTLSELGMTWISSWIHYPNNKPIILFGQFWHEYIGVIKRNMLLHKAEEDMMKICTDPNEVVQYLKDYNGKIGQLV